MLQELLLGGCVVGLAVALMKGLSQDEDAERLGVSQECWEKGKAKMPSAWTSDTRLERDLRRIQKRLDRMVR